MYDVVFMRTWRTPIDLRDGYAVAKNIPTLGAASAARRMTGDLVVYAGTLRVVPDETWLWGFEKTEKNYAYQAVQAAKAGR